MAKWRSIASRDTAPSDQYRSLCEADGGVEGRLLSPPGFSLWLYDAQLKDGATITWAGGRSDEGIYILAGALDIDGRRCPAGGAVIVEQGAKTSAVAVGATRIAHFGSIGAVASTGPLGPPALGGEKVHVVGPGGMFASGELEGVRAVWFGDGTCDTCRLQLFEVEAPPNDDPRGKAHSHSEDEIIFLLDGSISMGAYTLEPFTALSVPGDVRYALVGGADGHRFINFRRDVSIQIYALGSEPLLETAMARGGRVTGDVR